EKQSTEDAITLNNARIDADKNRLQVSSDILQLGLEEEHSITKRQEIQLQILNIKFQDRQLDRQKLDFDIAEKTALLEQEHFHDDRLAVEIDVLKLKRKEFDFDDQLFAAEKKHIEDIGKAQAEVGRDLEEALAKVSTGLTVDQLFNVKKASDV